MRNLKFLVLTDLGAHSDLNSIYALARTLAADPRCAQLDIASRGNAANSAFFTDLAGAQVQGTAVGQGFDFVADGSQFIDRTKTCAIADYDVIWLRMPHPVLPGFFTYLQSLADASETLVVNRPAGILELGNKAYLLNFPSLCPPMMLVRSAEDVAAFTSRFTAVLKPLRAYGGSGIVKINSATAEEDGTHYPLEQWLALRREKLEKEGYLAMKFLDNVTEGDKRILVVNGRILGASLRLPSPDSWLCNVAQGGTSVPAEINQEEREIIETISPVMLANGVVFFGADTLMGDNGKRVLSEINTLSIGGFPQAEIQTGRPIVQQAIDELFNYCYELS